jgi:hypothetical protein
MRHELHDVDDPVAIAQQALHTIQSYPSYAGHPQQPAYPQQQQQQQQQQQDLGPVPGAPAPQLSIWETLRQSAQPQAHPYPQQMPMFEQQPGAPGPNGMMLPHSIKAPMPGQPGQLMPTTSTYQTMPGRSTFTVRLQKRDMGGRRSFGMKINWNEQHRRIEVTEVVPSAFPNHPLTFHCCKGTRSSTHQSRINNVAVMICLQMDQLPMQTFQ